MLACPDCGGRLLSGGVAVNQDPEPRESRGSLVRIQHGSEATPPVQRERACWRLAAYMRASARWSRSIGAAPSPGKAAQPNDASRRAQIPSVPRNVWV